MSGGASYKRIRVPHPVTGEIIKPSLHVYVWLVANGEWAKGQTSTPEGYELHHKDFNPFNNDLSNLQLVTESEHTAIHWNVDRERKVTAFKKRMEAVPAEVRAGAQIKKAESMKRYYASLTVEQRREKMAKIRVHHQKLSEDDVREIRRLYKKRDRGGVGALCARYGISASHIRQIVSRRLFPNVL
jgi:hypothetical protein